MVLCISLSICAGGLTFALCYFIETVRTGNLR